MICKQNQINIHFCFIILDSSISSFQTSNEGLFPNKRLLKQRIREIRQKLMSHAKQEKDSINSSS